MIIIGQTENGYLVNIPYDEIKALLAISDSRRMSINNIKIGTNLSMTVALNNLNLLKDITISESYSALGRLNTAKDELEKVINVVESCKVPLLNIQEKIKAQQV